MKWYSNKKVQIFFNDKPLIGIRYTTPTMTKKQRKTIEKYPFINKRKLQVYLEDCKKEKIYTFCKSLYKSSN